MSKRYDRILDERFAMPALRAVHDYLIGFRGTESEIHPKGRFGIDLLYRKDGHSVGSEVEHRVKWMGNSWPASWATIHIPDRKSKQIQGLGRDFDWFEFWTLNNPMTRAMVVDGSGFMESLKVDVFCDSPGVIADRDPMRDIPINLWWLEFCNLETGETERNQFPMREEDPPWLANE